MTKKEIEAYEWVLRNYKRVTKKASHWFNGQGSAIPVSSQISSKFNLDPFTAARVARSAMLWHNINS